GQLVPWLPPRTITVVVVDPEVGSGRRALVVSSRDRFYVGPDNGVLTPILDDAMVVSADRPRYWLPQVSRTFHGRDVFGPLAAHLQLGVALRDLGSVVHDPLRLSWPTAVAAGEGWRGEVIDVDGYGNLATNLPPAHHGHVAIAEYEVPVCACYADRPAGQPLAVINGSGELEVAVNLGSAAERFGGIGQRVEWYP
ncbi:MAG TPA: SAM-dependent chlorinase/fluorinase, partial [Candidatus Xenobia bacterium]